MKVDRLGLSFRLVTTYKRLLKNYNLDVVNTSSQKLGVHLANNYKSGVNVAYESVGGVLLDSTIDNLAVNGKCIQIGFISNYQSERGLASQA